ncbi:hypothetical protein CHS0354_034242 [Potamilus streckersoni]|uniref:TGF-beta family profile domain-containing protein n=1 Tax=Potamilus streckersoni TaxID=2493646 RepID=A0AAE0W1R5_9BIVA|nr:hypothetical protein CHS0354_034242 [Potamilus streckersoni]
MQAMEKRVLNLLRLQQKPNSNKMKAEENAATLYMLSLYKNMESHYEDVIHGIEQRRYFLPFNSAISPDIHEINDNEFIISFVNQAGQLALSGEKSDLLLYFKFSDVSSPAIVTAAELKLYKQRSLVSNEAIYLIEVFRMKRENDTEDTSLQPEVDMTVSGDYEGWLSMQITNAARYWNDFRTENLGLYIRVTDVKTGHEIDSVKSGIIGNKGPENQKPFIIGIFNTKTEEHPWHKFSALQAQNVVPTENKSEARKTAVQQITRQACRRQELYVNFTSIGWNSWIIAPAGYNAFYCSGECKFPLTDHMNATMHATVQSRVHDTKPEIPNPCCVPNKLSNIQLLYKDDNDNVVYKIYQGMVVETCGCL